MMKDRIKGFAEHRLAGAGALNKLLYEIACFGVIDLPGRMFHGVGRNRDQRAAHLTVACHAADADGIDRTAGTVGGIFHRQAHLDSDRESRKAASFHPQITNLVVILPGNIIGRADMDIVFMKRCLQLALNGGCF